MEGQVSLRCWCLLVGQCTSSLNQAKGRVSQRDFTADAHMLQIIGASAAEKSLYTSVT